MPEAAVLLGSIAPGALTSVGVWALSRRGGVRALRRSIAESARERIEDGRSVVLRRRIAAEIERAGWKESPARVVALALVCGCALAALGLASALFVEPLTSVSIALGGALGGLSAVAFAVHSAAARRRTRLSRELAPLLELFVLELSAGGSALSALGSVTMQLDGELAAELRRLLIASQISGSASFEFRLRAYAETMQVAALSSLATILTASREYGTAVTQGVRALAVDLRRAQRRDLIAHSRRSLNHVLFPAAIGVLLPFLAILLFPAVTSLQRNLR